jgi:hypothetical protein
MWAITAGVSYSVRTHTDTGAFGVSGGWGQAPGTDDLEPRTFLNLYKITHSESTVDKWNNFAFRFPAIKGTH